MNKLCYLFLGIWIFIPTTILAQSQTGSVKGIVTSKDNPVVAANVALEEIQKGAATDIDGRFFISNIERGTYSLIISAVGFTSYKQEVSIPASDTLTLNIQINTRYFGA